MGRNKRQARLAFNPLPTSSPTNSTAIKENGQRSYANVGYEGSQRQSKRRRVANEDVGDNEAEFAALPTPVKSSQFPASSTSRPSRTSRISEIEVQGEPEPRTTTRSSKSRRGRAAQGKLDFTNHIGVRLDDSEEEIRRRSASSSDSSDNSIMRTKTPARARAAKSKFPTQRPRVMIQEESSEDELQSESHSTPRKSSPLKRLRSGRRAEEPEPRRTRRRTRNVASYEDDEEDDAPVSSFRRRRSSAIEIEDAEPESSGDDAPELYSSPGRKRATRATTNKSYQHDDFVVLSSDDEIREIRSSNKSQKTKRKTKASKSAKEDIFVVSDNEEDEEDPEEEEVPARKKRLRRQRQLTELEKEDLDEDLKNLRSSPPSDHGRPKRAANSRKDALAALKRRRAGLEEEPRSPTRRAANGRQPLVIESSEEEEGEGEDAPLDIDDVGFYEGPADARQRGRLDGEDEADDFVVDDDEDGPMGIPDDLDIDLPIYLTGVTRMKPKELFRYAVEWMVQKKLNPAYNMDKEKYDITFQRLDDEVRGLSGSKFTSSVWTRDFTVSLQARPGIEVIELSGLQTEMIDKCQACNRSGHPATFRIEFTGKPYNPHSLEPIEQEGDEEDSDDENDPEDSDSDSDREEYDHKDRLVPSEKRAYSVGRFCKENAMTAHALEHWKFQLNCWIVEWLDAEGHLTNELIVKRDRWDEPKRRKYARKVVKEMEEVGQIKQLHRQFRDEIDSAKERKSAWQRGGGE